LAGLSLLVPLLALATPASTAEPAPQPSAPVSAPASAAKAGSKYHATIRRTAHGIPHITARNFASLGFGAGYAAAESSICTLADTLITARGQRSRWLGPKGRYNDQVTLDASNLQVDAFVTDLHDRKVVEKLLADKKNGPGHQARRMVRGYTAGINKWVATNRVTDPACKGARYLKQKATPLDLWYGVYLANLLASSGVFVKEIVDADPPSPDDPGLPNPTAASVSRKALLRGLGRETPFGSNATAVGGKDSTTGKGMLLGNPHFPWRGRYRFTQQQLTIPGKYDVAGASLVGSPVVNIGWNKSVAWSHTVSTAYRFTPYEYRLASPATPTTYLTDSGPAELEHRQVKVTVKTKSGLKTVDEDMYRTPQGYVIDAPALLMPWSVGSVWAIRDANAEQLRTIDTFLEMGKARNVHDLLRRQDAAGGMPWVNTTAADRKGDVVYADHSVVPNVPNAMAQQCKTPTGEILDQLAGLPGLDGTRADSTCAWQTDDDSVRPGVFGPKNLPITFRRDWVSNANDSYWTPNDTVRLEGYAHIIGCEQCERTMRTRMVDHYVMDRLEKGKISPSRLRGFEHENRVMAGEVMRANGALDAICDQTGETEACQALHDWDGHSNIDSRGYAIFEAFIAHLPANDPIMWNTPFDASDPLNTPRDLNSNDPQLVQSMTDAIQSLRDAGVPFNATWGSLQVAGDRGAPPIALGGGTGDAAGNANALASRWPKQNKKKYRPITYGSSHIQAIAFLSGGRVSAHTILTYSQSENPKSPFSSDQTRLFAKKKWVKFAFTPRQIRRQTISKTVISGR
jgi:acyl-homoserine-lactone acylase